MVSATFCQETIMRQMRAERLRAVREQARHQASCRTTLYKTNKNNMKKHVLEEKRHRKSKNEAAARDELERQLHRVLVDTGAGHDAAHHFSSAEAARQKRRERRNEVLKKKTDAHSREAASRLHLDQASLRESTNRAKNIGKKREEQSLVDREEARLYAESRAAALALEEQSERIQRTEANLGAHSHEQMYSQQGSIKLQERRKVVVRAQVTRHGAVVDHDSTIVVNESDLFKTELHKARKNEVLKELISRHNSRARYKKAKKESIEKNLFSNIEHSFSMLSSMDRSYERRNRLKNVEGVHRKFSQKDTRLTGGSGRNPQTYNALVRHNFEKQFFDNDTNNSKTLSSSRVKESSFKNNSYSWQKVSSTGYKPNQQTRRVPTTSIGGPLPEWQTVEFSATDLVGKPTSVPAHSASFLSVDDPYLGVGANIDTSSTETTSPEEARTKNVLQLLDDMNVDANQHHPPSFDPELNVVRKEKKEIHDINAMFVSGDSSTAFDSGSVRSQSTSATESDGASETFRHVFELDAIHSSSNNHSPSTSSPQQSFIFSNSVEANVIGRFSKFDEVRKSDNHSMSATTDMNSEGNKIDSVFILESETNSKQSSCLEDSTFKEVFDISDDSLRVDPERYEEYVNTIEAEKEMNTLRLHVDSSSVVTAESGALSPPHSPLVISTTPPRSVDSEDQVSLCAMLENAILTFQRCQKLNALAKRSSGSTRHYANFSVDSNDIMFDQDSGLPYERTKERRKHSISSVSTTEAHHDTSLAQLLEDSLSRTTAIVPLSPVASADSLVDLAHEDSPFSSVSGIEGLEEDSLHEDLPDQKSTSTQHVSKMTHALEVATTFYHTSIVPTEYPQRPREQSLCDNEQMFSSCEQSSSANPDVASDSRPGQTLESSNFSTVLSAAGSVSPSGDEKYSTSAESDHLRWKIPSTSSHSSARSSNDNISLDIKEAKTKDEYSFLTTTNSSMSLAGVSLSGSSVPSATAVISEDVASNDKSDVKMDWKSLSERVETCSSDHQNQLPSPFSSVSSTSFLDNKAAHSWQEAIVSSSDSDSDDIEIKIDEDDADSISGDSTQQVALRAVTQEDERKKVHVETFFSTDQTGLVMLSQSGPSRQAIAAQPRDGSVSSTASDTLELRLSMESDNTLESSSRISAFLGHQPHSSHSATIRNVTSRGDFQELWLNEPSFSVTSSNSSDGWKAALSDTEGATKHDIVASNYSADRVAQTKVAVSKGLSRQVSVISDINAFFSDSDDSLEIDSKESTPYFRPSVSGSEGEVSASVPSEAVGYEIQQESLSDDGSDSDLILDKYDGQSHIDDYFEKNHNASPSSSSKSGSTDPLNELRRMVGENEEYTKSTTSNYSDSKFSTSTSSEGTDLQEGETSLGELLGFSDNSSFSISDDTSP